MNRLSQGFGAQADVAIIGSGHNGLIAAYYLSRAGLKTVVFERRPDVGGGAVTSEIHPGFRGPALSHETLLEERIAREMNLVSHGLTTVAAAVRVCSLEAGGAPLVIYDDAARTADSIRQFSARDADAYPI